MIQWIKMWLDNRFPRKPKPAVGLVGLLTEEQKAQVRADLKQMKQEAAEAAQAYRSVAGIHRGMHPRVAEIKEALKGSDPRGPHPDGERED